MYFSPPLTPQTRKIPQAGEGGTEVGGISKILAGGAPGRRAFGSVSQASRNPKVLCNIWDQRATAPFPQGVTWLCREPKYTEQDLRVSFRDVDASAWHMAWKEHGTKTWRLDLRARWTGAKDWRQGQRAGRHLCRNRVAGTPRAKALRLPPSCPAPCAFCRSQMPSQWEGKPQPQAHGGHISKLNKKRRGDAREAAGERLPGGRRSSWGLDGQQCLLWRRDRLLSPFPSPTYSSEAERGKRMSEGTGAFNSVHCSQLLKELGRGV